MTVVYLDTCHECERPISAGIFCRRCLAVAAGAPTNRGQGQAAGSWDGASTGAVVEPRAPRLVLAAATTRNKNTPTTSAWKAGRRGAYNHGG